MRIKTVGDLRSMIEDLEDDYTIEMSVNRNVPVDVVNRLNYWCCIDTDRQDGFKFEGVGVGDKELCISVEVPNDMCERIRVEEHKTGENQ